MASEVDVRAGAQFLSSSKYPAKTGTSVSDSTSFPEVRRRHVGENFEESIEALRLVLQRAK